MPTPRPVRTTTTFRDLGSAWATVTADQTDVLLAFGDTNGRVVLTDSRAVIRRLLTDATAQLDAIEAGS
jgi:hypothetical protein